MSALRLNQQLLLEILFLIYENKIVSALVTLVIQVTEKNHVNISNIYQTMK